MKQRRFLGLIAVLGLFGLLLAGCTRSGAHGWAPPATAEDMHFVTTGAGHLDAIAANGTRVWRFPNDWNLPDKTSRSLHGIYGLPMLSSDGSVLYLGDYNGRLYAFRPGDFSATATQQPNAASLKLNGPVIGGLAYDAANDTIYVSSDQAVFAVKASDMAKRIDNRDAPVDRSVFFLTGDAIWARPVIANGKVLIASLDGKLYAVDEATRQLDWSFNGGRGLVTTPVVVGDVALVAGFNEQLTAVNLADGSVKWTYNAPNWIWSRPAVDNGVAYFGDFDGILRAVDVATGAEKWSLDLGKGSVRSGPAVDGNMLVIAGDHGWLFGVDLTTQKIAWQKDLGVSLLADLVKDGSRILLAPSGCVVPPGEKQKVYYTSVDPTNGELSRATGVC